jgi:4-hydroxy-4-methyl-2-oxoglutarate aldolase
MAENPSRYLPIPTATIFDASVRLGIIPRIAPIGISMITRGNSIISGPAVPSRHYGSVDIFLEAINNSRKGDVLVIDNGGRRDEACIGDLVTLEAQRAGLSAIAVWGCHRDTNELRKINLPVFSLGHRPSAPTRVLRRPKEALKSARFGSFRVTRDDVVFGDPDGLLFFARKHVNTILETAKRIRKTERHQASEARRGRTLREQFRFDEYLAKKRGDSSFTFRKHLRGIKGAIEE